MRLVATGLLVLMAAIFVAARYFDHLHPAVGYVRAFSEAAMVGGLADWFAVTALFRHPLHLPIPHTAIIPRNKDRIADTLAAFLRDNFLIPKVVARRMQRLNVAGAAGRWLANPPMGRGRIGSGASRLAADILESLDQERLGGMAKGAIAGRLRAIEIAPLFGQALNAAIANGRHLPLLDGMIRWASRVLEANEHLIRDMVHARAGTVMRWTGLDETLASKIIDGLHKLITEMAEDPDHPLRAKAEEGLERLAHDLQHKPALRDKVEAFKGEMLDNQAFHRWIEGLWEASRAALLRVARDPERAMAGKVGEALKQFGETLQTDRKLADTINRFARRSAVGAASDYGDGIVRLVSDTIRGWDARTVTGRLENAVGRDLQYIRINGTLVGGLVGVAIHAVDAVLR
ncbi:uncharacterized membrane-anchored protein YjiN (DUF445 family) [Sphingomonas naasensis]|uniref:DUF445 domain-containing protein n=1 Tax=Sphingomonas naasensis TaxID=1344951 RepID=A0A4S1WFW6_9SPHN|nr:DUF445 domain-containing protein [Sphingomonas naasensis]NIJ21540.1 uncharacterized membrane-anchored protein YjiN (DUF445 family) [Sphingomonas naasensis]TGX41513.1 DUF445 domain-containing protein [Sphingomonas naasensis]